MTDYTANYNEVKDTVADKVSNITDKVEVKKLNIEIAINGKTYKLDVDDSGAKVEVN